AGQDRDVGVDDVAVGGGYGTRSDVPRQRRDARRVAEPGAVVHVVRAEARADQLLEEVGLLIRALRRAEAGHGRGPTVLVDRAEAVGHQAERLLPRGLAE